MDVLWILLAFALVAGGVLWWWRRRNRPLDPNTPKFGGGGNR